MMDDIPYIDYLVYKILSLVANPTNGVSQSIEVLCQRIFRQKKKPRWNANVINFWCQYENESSKIFSF